MNLKTAIETIQNETRRVKNQAAQEGGGRSESWDRLEPPVPRMWAEG